MAEKGNILGNEELIQRLRALTPLKLIGDEDIKGFLKSSKLLKYEPEETIIEEGEYSSWIYFLIKGEVGIQKEGETLNVLRRCGDLFGEMCIIDNSPRSASIVAVTSTVCLAIDTSYSEKLKGSYKNAFNAVLYRIFAEILSERLRHMDEELLKLKNENYSLITKLEMLKSNTDVEILP